MIRQMAISARPGTRFVRHGELFEVRANNTLTQVLTVTSVINPDSPAKRLKYPCGLELAATSRPFRHTSSSTT